MPKASKASKSFSPNLSLYHQRWQQFYRSATARLMLTYLLIIMALVMVMSFTNYRVVMNQFYSETEQQEQLTDSPMVKTLIERRFQKAQSGLVFNLVISNLIIFAIAIWFSYTLARFTLRPIEEAIDAQERFLADASHELKTPITAIQTTAEVALRDPNLTLKDAKRTINGNNEAAVRLRHLAEGMLDLTRPTQTAKQLRSVDVSSAANDAINQVVELAIAKSIQIQDQTKPLHARADFDGLVQVLVILLDNAIKYTPPEGQIILTTKLTKKQIQIDVSDTGQGISKQDLEHVFDRFYRVDKARCRDCQGGHGLGLAIAKRTIEQMHGQIKVSSELEMGTVVSLSLEKA